MFRKKRVLLFLLAALVLSALTAAAQSKVRVKFAKGASSTTLRGKISGYQYIDYVVGARAGQTMSVNISATNAFTQFVIFDQTMETLDLASGVEKWKGELPASGNYTIRVLLPRAEARRRTGRAAYSLRISIR